MNEIELLATLQSYAVSIGYKCRLVNGAGKRTMLPVLIAALDSADEMIAAHAADWLSGLVNEPEIQQRLKQASEQHQFASVRKIAAWALE